MLFAKRGEMKWQFGRAATKRRQSGGGAEVELLKTESLQILVEVSIPLGWN